MNSLYAALTHTRICLRMCLQMRRFNIRSKFATLAEYLQTFVQLYNCICNVSVWQYMTTASNLRSTGSYSEFNSFFLVHIVDREKQPTHLFIIISGLNELVTKRCFAVIYTRLHGLDSLWSDNFVCRRGYVNGGSREEWDAPPPPNSFDAFFW